MGPDQILPLDKIRKIVLYHFPDKQLLTVDVFVKWIRFQLEGDPTDYLLRVWKADPGHKWEFNLRIEIAFMLYCEQIGFTHLNQLVAYSLDRDIINYDYYIYKYLEGLPFDDLVKSGLLSDTEMDLLYYNLGVVVGKFHSHKVFQRTDIVLDSDGHVYLQASNPWQFTPEIDWVKDHHDQILDHVKDHPQFLPYLDQIMELFTKYADFRKEPPRSIGLVHLDLAADNLIVKNRGQSIDDFYMIDHTFAQIGPITLDLARIERRFTTWRGTLNISQIPHFLDVFFKGYQTHSVIPEEYQTGEGMIYRLNQLIDDIGLLKREEYLLYKTHIVDDAIWELDRMIEAYL